MFLFEGLLALRREWREGLSTLDFRGPQRNVARVQELCGFLFEAKGAAGRQCSVPLTRWDIAERHWATCGRIERQAFVLQALCKGAFLAVVVDHLAPTA